MRRLVAILVAFGAVVFATGSLFVVPEGQTALVIELDKVKGAPLGPGLHFKWPLIARVQRYDARLIAWDGDPERIPVKDSKFIHVDTFARWRITDAERFYKAVRDEAGAQSRLDDILDGSVRDVVSAHFLNELVRTTDQPIQEDGPSEDAGALPEGLAAAEEALVGSRGELDTPGKRAEVRDRIVELCEGKLAELDLGLELVDFRIKRIDYTEQVQEEVYRRMISEQERIAERYRAQGEGRRAEIAGRTSQEQKRIQSESYRRAQEIMGQAEAEATRIYAAAYERDPDFFRFVESLETYARIFGDDDTLILSTDSDLLRYLKTQR